ncbi:MAG: hypothetical protein L6Q81_02160 [Bacteroidia bacterium]|nr:hypothetical protein [Bacteroidia bacterium]
MYYSSRSSSRHTQDLGYCLPLTCHRCNEVSYWHLLRETSKESGPLFTSSEVHRHSISCDKCRYIVDLNPEQAQRALYLLNCTRAYSAGQMSPQEYEQRLKEVNYLR